MLIFGGIALIVASGFLLDLFTTSAPEEDPENDKESLERDTEVVYPETDPSSAHDAPTTLPSNDGGQYIVGTESGDFLEGTGYSDEIYGGTGENTILGGGGNDLIYGGGSDDQLFGGAGDDWISGISGDNIIHGGYGHDTLFGGTGNDIISGEDGDDLIFSGSGANLIFGGEGDDVLVSTESNSGTELFGGNGNDTLILGLGNIAFGEQGVNKFVLQELDGKLPEIMDFKTDVDKILIHVKNPLGTPVEVDIKHEDGGSSIILINDKPVGMVIDAPGLSVNDIEVVHSHSWYDPTYLRNT